MSCCAVLVPAAPTAACRTQGMQKVFISVPPLFDQDGGLAEVAADAAACSQVVVARTRAQGLQVHLAVRVAREGIAASVVEQRRKAQHKARHLDRATNGCLV